MANYLKSEKINKNDLRNNIENTKEKDKLLNSYVYLYSYWENLYFDARKSDVENIATMQLVQRKNKLLLPVILNKLGIFPMKYKVFCKLQKSQKIEKILKNYPDLLINFVYKNSHDKKIAITIDQFQMHGAKFENIEKWRLMALAGVHTILPVI